MVRRRGLESATSSPVRAPAPAPRVPGDPARVFAESSGRGNELFLQMDVARGSYNSFPSGVVDSLSLQALFLKNYYRSWKEEAAVGGCERPGSAPGLGEVPAHLTPRARWPPASCGARAGGVNQGSVVPASPARVRRPGAPGRPRPA